MHYKIAMKHQITNKIKLICVCLLLPLIALGQKNQNAQLAHEFLKNGHYTKASELYSDLYNTHKSTNYYQGLIECYFSLNQIDEAEKLVKKHTKKDNNASILVDYAHVYILKEEEKKAKKKFNELFKLLESNPQYTISVANKLTKYNYLEEAVKAYEIALKDPSKSSYRFKLARIYGQLNNLEMMYENYLEVVMSNKAYLKNVKTMLSRTVSKDSENENNIQDLTVSEHIELIKNHDNKIEISFDDLPEVSQSYINSLENNITTEQILHAQNIGYEVKIKRESRSLVSLLNILYIYFDQDGDILLDDNYDEDGDGEYDIFDEWEDFMCFDIQFPISVIMPDDSQITIDNEDELYEAVELYYEMSDEYDGLPEINFPFNIVFY